MKVTAIVPMRHESLRVPGKNYRPFAGRPLYHHVVETLLAAETIDGVVIDTDSQVITEDARRTFPMVRVMSRPEHLRDDRIPMNAVLLNTTAGLDADWFLQTHSTNPLLRPQTVDRAVAELVAAQPEFDSLFSVKPLQARFWDAAGRPLNHDPQVLQRTQDLEPLYEENSCLYLFSRASLTSTGNRIGARPKMFVMGKIESADIDDEADFLLAEALYMTTRKLSGDWP